MAYSHTTRADGLVLTAAIYNADHQNHIDNHTPEKLDDFSTNVAEMQTQTDPGEQGSESLPTSLSEELARLRFAINELKGTSYWYESWNKKVQFTESSGGPTTATGEAALYTKDTSGRPELYYRSESDGTEVQITDSAAVAGTGGGSYPRNHLSGLALTVTGGANEDISMASGKCRDSTDVQDFTATAAIVKQIDANWAAGSAAGGFPSALTIASRTWYHFFIIGTTTGGVDAGFDSASTASNLLATTDAGVAASNFTLYRRLGSVLTTTASVTHAITRFVQEGDTFLWQDPPLDFDGTLASTATALVISTPPDVKCQVVLNAWHQRSAASNTGMLYISSPDQDDESVSVSAAPLMQSYYTATSAATRSVANEISVMTSTESKIRMRGNTGSITLRVATTRYVDSRGRLS